MHLHHSRNSGYASAQVLNTPKAKSSAPRLNRGIFTPIARVAMAHAGFLAGSAQPYNTFGESCGRTFGRVEVPAALSTGAKSQQIPKGGHHGCSKQKCVRTPQIQIRITS